MKHPALLFSLTGFLASAVLAGEHAYIGINFHGRTAARIPVPAEMAAGLVPQRNWNNFGSGQLTDTSSELKDSEGKITGAGILMYPPGVGAWFNEASGDVASEGDDLMLKAYYRVGKKDDQLAFTFKIYELPPPEPGESYSVIVYSMAHGKAEQAELDVTVQGRKFHLYSQRADEWNSRPEWLAATATDPDKRSVANHARFDGIRTDPGMPLEIVVRGGSDATVSAIQILRVSPD
jgi:hypothetical protein